MVICCTHRGIPICALHPLTKFHPCAILPGQRPIAFGNGGHLLEFDISLFNTGRVPLNQKLHTCIVLDRSGSMETCRTDAIGAVNSFLRQSKSDQGTDGRLSLIAFDTGSIDVLRDRVPLATCAEIRPEEYQPRGGTPLLDAVAHGVALLDKSVQPKERQVLAIMTDGLENASKEYSKEAVHALLTRKQKEQGWLVVYLGADHDAWEQARHLGLSQGNTAAFHKDAASVAMAAITSRVARYAMASAPIVDAMDGGFTAAERDSLERSSKSGGKPGA